MNKFDELLDELQNIDITATSIEWSENLPDWIWERIKDHVLVVDSNIDVDTRRWYETSITVIEVFGGYLGIRHITNIFSESMEVVDCSQELEFYKMEPVQTTTYKIANDLVD